LPVNAIEFTALPINPGNRKVILNLKTDVATHSAVLLKRQWLSDKSFEIMISSPPGFQFKPGQRISLSLGGHVRDYSIVSAPQESELIFCIRSVAGGKLSTLLSVADIDAPLSFYGPHGYFTFRPSPRPAVFVATGTGIAPFCSMARAGISDFALLHGVRTPEDLYYAEQFKQSAHKYVPCLTEAKKLPSNAFQGKVTDYLEQNLPSGAYDFYLCGRREMIRDATLLIDERFPDSLVYTEMFF
jgi:ferredoxin-NADP reductase